jgi:hypothetical protein
MWEKARGRKMHESHSFNTHVGDEINAISIALP